MSRGNINLQDSFLNQARKERIPVTVHLLNGSKITGVIKGFDNFILFLKNEGQCLIYKHAVSAIVPERPVKGMEGPEARGQGTSQQPGEGS